MLQKVKYNKRAMPVTNPVADKFSFAFTYLNEDIDDGETVTSLAIVSAPSAILKSGDVISVRTGTMNQSFTLSADVAAYATSISVTSVATSVPLLRGSKITIDNDNLIQQYQRKTQGTIAGMSVSADTLGPITYADSVYSIIGVDPTYVKVLPRDFMINEDGAYEALEFKDSANSGLQVGDSAQEMGASVNIPYGTTATSVQIWGSNTSKVVEVYELDVNANGIGTSLGAGTTNGGEIDITDTAATATNYLLILVKVTATSNRIYGGKVNLTQ